MALELEHWNELNNGELTETALTDKLESEGYRVTRYVYPPGTRFPDHAHDVDKIDAVISGQFNMQIAGESVVLNAGDMLKVPKGVIHNASVLGKEPVVSLDAIKIE